MLFSYLAITRALTLLYILLCFACSYCSQWCLFSFCSHPCSTGCLYVSIRHVALAQRWRQRPVLHWVVPPSRSGCESEAWIRHPRLPTQYFLSRIENERGWWLRARCFRPCEWLWESSHVYVVLLKKQRCDPSRKSFVVFVLVWQSPEGWRIHSLYSKFQSFYIQFPNFLSTHICQSKDLLFSLWQHVVLSYFSFWIQTFAIAFRD